MNDTPSPAELQAMLDDLSLDPDTRHRVELLLEATLAWMAERPPHWKDGSDAF